MTKSDQSVPIPPAALRLLEITRDAHNLLEDILRTCREVDLLAMRGEVDGRALRRLAGEAYYWQREAVALARKADQ